MKKTLLLLTLGLAGLFSAQAAEEHYLSRGGWTITPCSEVPASWENGNGPASFMIDDDVTTYWHQNWDSDVAGPHWFIVDLGSSNQMDGFDYWRRQGQGVTNGQFYTGKAYVSTTPFTSLPTILQRRRMPRTLLMFRPERLTSPMILTRTLFVDAHLRSLSPVAICL